MVVKNAIISGVCSVVSNSIVRTPASLERQAERGEQESAHDRCGNVVPIEHAHAAADGITDEQHDRREGERLHHVEPHGDLGHVGILATLRSVSGTRCAGSSRARRPSHCPPPAACRHTRPPPAVPPRCRVRSSQDTTPAAARSDRTRARRAASGVVGVPLHFEAPFVVGLQQGQNLPQDGFRSDQASLAIRRASARQGVNRLLIAFERNPGERHRAGPNDLRLHRGTIDAPLRLLVTRCQPWRPPARPQPIPTTSLMMDCCPEP